MADDEKKIEETEVSDTTEPVADEQTQVSDTSEPVAEEQAPEEVSDTPAPEADETPEVEAEPVADEVSDTPEAAEEAPAEEGVSDTPVAKPTKSRRHVPRSLRRTRTKLVREKAAKRKPITRTEKPATDPARRQQRRGIVVSDKGDKTIVVKVDVIKSHPKYKKVVRRSVKFHAHDEQNAAGIGDTVRIVETRPISKTKHWRLAEVVEKAR
jgi:small subunit ribosomal protein S17